MEQGVDYEINFSKISDRYREGNILLIVDPSLVNPSEIYFNGYLFLSKEFLRLFHKKWDIRIGGGILCKGWGLGSENTSRNYSKTDFHRWVVTPMDEIARIHYDLRRAIRFLCRRRIKKYSSRVIEVMELYYKTGEYTIFLNSGEMR